MSPRVTSGTVRDRVRRARWELRMLAGRYPALSRVLIRQGGEFPTQETDIVIEGFPRSGNTFAVIAFEMAQPGPVSIAHHVHAPASVIQAVKESIPTLMLIRRPEDTISSFVLRYPHLHIAQALRSYIRFYEPLLGLQDRLVLGPFEEITSNFGAVIGRVNRLFATEFAEFEHSEQNVHMVQIAVDEWDRGAFESHDELVRGRARPVEARERMKEEARAMYRSPGLARARDRAEWLYEDMVAERGIGQNEY
jgi:hypothetical protein